MDDLIKRALAHDRDALEELLFCRYDWLLDVARKKIPAAHRSLTPDDILQESLVKILRAFETFQPTTEAALFAWLKTIVQNTVKDALRTQGREKQVDGTSGPLGGDDDFSDLLAKLAVSEDPRASVIARGKELHEAFRVAFAGLSPNYQQVVELFYLQDRSIEEVAEIMETTVSAVRGYRQRAREALKDALIRLSLYI